MRGVDSIREIPAEARREIITANQFERRNARQSVRGSAGRARGETEREREGGGRELLSREIHKHDRLSLYLLNGAAADQSMISRVALLESRPPSSELCYRIGSSLV